MGKKVGVPEMPDFESTVQYHPFGIFWFSLASMVVISHTHLLGGKGFRQLLALYGLCNYFKIQCNLNLLFKQLDTWQ